MKYRGNYTCKEVVQMYIPDLYNSVIRNAKELKSFKIIELKPGGKSAVSFNITSKELAFTNIDMEYVVEAGEFEIMVGNSLRDEELQKLTLNVE